MSFKKGRPGKKEGRNGDMTIRIVPPLGMALFIKVMDKWYSIPLEEEFKDREALSRVIPTKPAKYTGEIGFDKTSSTFELKQSKDDIMRYAGSTTIVERDVNDGNPSFQIGSSDTECFKISCDYKGGEKGLMTTTFSTSTAGEDANAGKMFFSVDGTRRLEINDSDLTIMGFGSATADTEVLIIENDVSAASMDDTRTSIAFYQEAYNASGADALADSAKITVGTIGNWTTADSGTHDAYMSFSSVLNGTMNTTIKAYGNGQTSFCEAGNEYVKILPHSTDSELDITGNFVLDASGDIELNADGSTITFKDASATHYSFEGGANPSLTMESLTYGDSFSITFASSGEVTLATIDQSAAAGDIILAPDGKVQVTASNDVNTALKIDSNLTGTTSASRSGLNVDIDQTGIVASGQSLVIRGVDNRINTEVPTMVGTTTVYGVNNNVTCGTSGTQDAYGIFNSVLGGDTNTGIYSNVTDGVSNHDIKMVSSANQADFCNIRTGANGATRIQTIDGDAAEAHLELIADGHVEISAALDNSTDNIAFQNASTTISAYQVHHGATWLYLYENGGASINDYLALQTEANGESKIWTYDAGGTDAHLEINADGDITLDAASGNIYVKDAGGNYTPGSDYEIATKKYVDDNSGGTNNHILTFTARANTRYDNWYFPSSLYGPYYYAWTSSQNSSSLPTVWYDSYNPNLVVPVAMTLKSYHFYFNCSAHTENLEFATLKGTGVTYGSAGNYTLSNVGATQAVTIGTSNILYKAEQTGLSVSFAAGDIVMPTLRRTTLDTSDFKYVEISWSAVFEVD